MEGTLSRVISDANGGLIANSPWTASLAAEKLTAKAVEPGRYDLILDPTNLWLTIHESIGHPTELDRAMGLEANYAGTSFVTPPEKMIGQLKYGLKPSAATPVISCRRD